MYCVNCGVKLPDGADKCPLCGTKAWRPEGAETAESTFPQNYPIQRKAAHYTAAGFLTVLAIAVCLSALIACLQTYGSIAWSGIVMLGIALGYLVAVVPLWFSKPRLTLFLILDFAGTCGYLLYICSYVGGHWFLSFAFPCTLIACLLCILTVYLYRYRGKGKLLLTGLFVILIGGCLMLVEFFQHITFHVPMFQWSLYCVSAFGLIGLFLILASLIRPLRAYLSKKFFI